VLIRASTCSDLGSSSSSVLGEPSSRAMEGDAEAVKSGRRGGGQVCQICGDGVGTTAEGDVFAACYVCGFPVCRPCYEYERKDGTQACPQCKTKYKRHKGKFLQPLLLHSHLFRPASPDPNSGATQLGKFGSLIKKNKNGGCF